MHRFSPLFALLFLHLLKHGLGVYQFLLGFVFFSPFPLYLASFIVLSSPSAVQPPPIAGFFSLFGGVLILCFYFPSALQDPRSADFFSKLSFSLVFVVKPLVPLVPPWRYWSYLMPISQAHQARMNQSDPFLKFCSGLLD